MDLFTDDWDCSLDQCPDYLLEVDPLDDLDIGMGGGVELPNFDYNLNSPLIRDEVDEFIASLRQGFTSSRYKGKWNFEEGLKWFRSLGVIWGTTLGSWGFHEWVFSQVIPMKIRSLSCKEEIKWIYEFLDAPTQVMNDYLSHVLQCEVDFPLRMVSKEQILNHDLMIDTVNQIQLYNIFHWVINLLNSSNKDARQEISKVSPFVFKLTKEAPKKNSFLVAIHVAEMGYIWVTTGFVYFQKWNRILDRNMCLMIKDLLGARVCSRLSLYRGDNDLSRDLVISKLDTLYNLGDCIFRLTGNYGYDLIKLVEGLCNLRFIELAHQFRNKIPMDNNFRRHITGSVSEFELLHNVDCQDFCRQILQEEDPIQVAIYYGSFRHWGHPFLDYFEGLSKLHEQVTKDSVVDEQYAKLLASDLAFKVLSAEFHKQKRWFVDSNLVDRTHPLYDHFVNQTWPTKKQILDYGDHWDELPLMQCYEIPKGLDPALLYADKSHSMNLSEVRQYLQSHPGSPIPSKKVLHTALFEGDLDVPAFLTTINTNGLDTDSLIIGLKGKEREVKRIGRFFSLMSWNLRLYFVITEYLIKKHFVPLFNGLTMADDYNSVIKKLLDRTIGQGESSYKRVTFANHFDYSKWNNTQRGKANNPTFTVMGQFFGLKNLFVRTHEFFERSFIYYNDRGDLLTCIGDRIENHSGHKICWQGQLGGLEGLRQKGWTVVSLLVIERESKVRNTLTKVLAQGDNQVVCTYYELPSDIDHQIVDAEIPNITQNNARIVSAISGGTKKLGLQVNLDETLISPDYLNYGKVILFRGKMLPLTTKRWSRVTCITNDQIPSLGNIMSAVSANALTVTQQSDHFIDSILNYLFFGAFCLYSIFKYHPILGSGIAQQPLNQMDQFTRMRMSINLLFLDPSLGGLSGTSLNRFLIRQFPDPVTESLSFWKIVHDQTQSLHIQRICVLNGNPPLGRVTSLSILKLLENPMGLNLPKGLNCITLLRDAVREQLTNSVDSIQNLLFRESIRYLRDQEQDLLDFLMSINPLFPRFLSEFRAGTFLGITESMVGLFQNSRTIRMVFKKRFASTVSELMIKYERKNIRGILAPSFDYVGTIWKCSSEQADLLREMSWGREVVGTTIPHPSELLGRISPGHGGCLECSCAPYPGSYISVIYPHGLAHNSCSKGPLPPYLGSKTHESTSLFQPWEKEIDVPLLVKSVRLRNAIQWFVPQSSNLSTSILNNLSAMTGLDWNEGEISFRRTGSAIHRFSCSRQSAGVYSSVNPNLLAYTFVTSDTLGEMNTVNHDFMYQSLLIYSQIVSVVHNVLQHTSISHHFHIKCPQCVREIADINLESDLIYTPSSTAHLLKLISGSDFVWRPTGKTINLNAGNWESLSPAEQSFQIGTTQGLIFSISVVNNESHSCDHTLFPESVARYVHTKSYLLGLLRGLIGGSTYMSIYHRDIYDPKRPIKIIHGALEYLLTRLLDSPHFIPSLSTWDLRWLTQGIPHRIPPSYPSSKKDLGATLLAFFHHHLGKETLKGRLCRTWSNRLWIFSDFRTTKWIGLLLCANYTYSLYYAAVLSTPQINKLREVKDLIYYFLSSGNHSDSAINLTPHSQIRLKKIVAQAYGCPYEIRFAVKGLVQQVPRLAPPLSPDVSEWSDEYVPKCSRIIVTCSNSRPNYKEHVVKQGYINDPLISGLRLAQLATGAHYKIRGILRYLQQFDDVLCGGDGSGGMSAAILRFSPNSKLIFNSLMQPTGESFMGVTPAGPAAITAMPSSIRSRCVNLESCWGDPSDLTSPLTWRNFLYLRNTHHLKINLVVLDMEVTTLNHFYQILTQLRQHLHELVESDGQVVVKCYASHLSNDEYIDSLSGLCRLFQHIESYTSMMSSSFTSEFYLVCKNLITDEHQGLFIDAESVHSICISSPSNRSVKDEFLRALKLKKANLLKGVPLHLIPKVEDELFAVLTHIGVETGTSRLITRRIESEVSSANIITYILVILIIGSNSIINTTEEHMSPRNYPSFASLQYHYALFVGCWMSISWIVEDLTLYQTLHWWIQNKVYYGFVQRLRQNGLNLIWKWNAGAVGKKLYKPSRLALSSQLIRLFTRLSKHVDTGFDLNKTVIRATGYIQANFNRRLTYNHILQNTGLLAHLSFAPSESNTPQPSTPVLSPASPDDSLQSSLGGFEFSEDKAAWTT